MRARGRASLWRRQRGTQPHGSGALALPLHVRCCPVSFLRAAPRVYSLTLRPSLSLPPLGAPTLHLSAPAFICLHSWARLAASSFCLCPCRGKTFSAESRDLPLMRQTDNRDISRARVSVDSRHASALPQVHGRVSSRTDVRGLGHGGGGRCLRRWHRYFLCLCPCLLSLFMSLPHTVFVYSLFTCLSLLFTCLSHFLACLHVYLTCSLAPTIAPVKPSSHLRPAPSSAPSGHALFNEPAYLTTLL